MNKLPFFLLCGVALLATACAVQSSSDSKKTSNVPVAPENIIGSWAVHQFDTLLLSDENVPYPVITFRDDARVVANAGCNTLSGEYTYAAPPNAEATASLIFADNLCQTLMFCPDDEVTRNEHLLAQAMDSVLTVTSCGSDSLLLQGKHSMLLVKTNAIH